MSTIRTKFIVVSLPRTGTMSLCQMAKDAGMEVSHAPGPAFEGFLGRADFVADTPAFRPSLIQSVLDRSDDVKFIYCEKEANSWVESMNKINLSRNYMNMYNQSLNNPESMSVHNKVDFEALNEILQGPFEPESAIDAFHKHRTTVTDLIPADRLLFYRFDQGWKPLAEFMGVDVPEKGIPHLNQDTMFDKLYD